MAHTTFTIAEVGLGSAVAVTPSAIPLVMVGATALVLNELNAGVAPPIAWPYG